jgi:hypothetical protein
MEGECKSAGCNDRLLWSSVFGRPDQERRYRPGVFRHCMRQLGNVAQSAAKDWPEGKNRHVPPLRRLLFQHSSLNRSAPRRD